MSKFVAIVQYQLGRGDVIGVFDSEAEVAEWKKRLKEETSFLDSVGLVAFQFVPVQDKADFLAHHSD